MVLQIYGMDALKTSAGGGYCERWCVFVKDVKEIYI